MDKLEYEKLISELKNIVLDMYRNAGDLDRWIQNLETESDGHFELEMSPHESTYLNMFIKMQYMYRQQVKCAGNYSSLDARENSIWERLILSTDPNRVIEGQES